MDSETPSSYATGTTTLEAHAAARGEEAVPSPDDLPARRAPRRGPHRFALHPGWLVVAACCGILIRGTIHSGLNTDVFWHLAAGNWMLSHHAVIRHDVFSYTVRGRPWTAEEWGFEVLLAWMVRHVGPITYWLLSGGACVLALLVTAARARLLGASTLWIAALSIPLAFALRLGLAPRPQDLSYLLFAVELLLLTLARRHRAALVALPFLFLVWCNLHGSFLGGLVLLALQVLVALAARLTADRPKHMSASTSPPRIQLGQPLRLLDATATLVASSVVTLVNPHGASLWTYVVKVTGAAPLNGIEEWQSPSFHDPVIIIAVGVPMLLALVLVATGSRRLELFDLLVWIGCVAASLHALRFIPYMGVAFVGFAAPWASRQSETIRRTLLTWPISLLAVAVFLTGGYRPANAVEKSTAPVASANWLEHRTGRVFSSYVWNDYLIERHIPVFVDGRTDLYFGTSVLRSYEAVSALSERPDSLFRRWDVRWVLWPAKSAFSNYMAEDPGWRLVKRFGQQEIFERA